MTDTEKRDIFEIPDRSVWYFRAGCLVMAVGLFLALPLGWALIALAPVLMAMFFVAKLSAEILRDLAVNVTQEQRAKFNEWVRLRKEER